MKRFNKKGFTLVELLAVIVILAIVVGITLVTVLPAIKDSKQKAFELSAETAADAISKQYELSMVLQGSTTIKEFGTSANPKHFGQSGAATYDIVGLKENNYDNTSGTYYVDVATGKVCVKLTASETGDYSGLANKNIESSGCSEIKNIQQEAFELSAEIAEDYLNKQYQPGALICGRDATTRGTMEQCIENAGLKPENYVRTLFQFKNGKFCVELFAYTNDTLKNGVYNLAKNQMVGEYSDIKSTKVPGVYVYINASGSQSSKNINTAVAYSSGCGK